MLVRANNEGFLQPTCLINEYNTQLKLEVDGALTVITIR